MRCTAAGASRTTRARLGLANGADAIVRMANGGSAITRADRNRAMAMMPGVVSLPHGWGHDLPGAALAIAAERPGANLNLLMDDAARDPLSGNAVLSGVAVSVSAG